MSLSNLTFVGELGSPGPLSRVARRTHCILLLAMTCILPARALAQQDSETVVVDKQTLQLLLRRVNQLENRINQLEAESSSSPSANPTINATQSTLVLPDASSHLVIDTPADPEVYPADPEKMDVGKTLLHIRGFADFGLYGTNQKGATTGFNMGELNLFVTSNISDKLKFLSEIVFENEGPGPSWTSDFAVDVERALLAYSYNDNMNIAIGRLHTAIGYYNTAYHHSAWMQTATRRPLLFSFEDEGGILPTHLVGVSASGQIPSGNLGLHYVAEVGDGPTSRTDINTGVEIPVAVNNRRSVDFTLFARPNSIPGLQVGASVYRDILSPNSTERIRETIVDGYAVITRCKVEWLNEGLIIRHSIPGISHVYETPAFYSQLSKRFGSYTPYFLYQYVNAPETEPIFQDVGLRSGPSAGLRFDATESVAFKLQYDYTTLRKQQAVNSVGLQVGFTF
jgi:hypothetical protein